MKLGLYGINMGVCLDAEAISEVARAAEGAGFDSLWTAEHVVLPDPQTPESPIPAQTPLLDPAVALATAAAHTTSIRLATGIIILPQRNPAVLAKELASLDVLSGGRLIFGLGAGYIPAEFAALGASFVDRGATTDEYIEAIRTLWTEERPHYSGRFVSFAEIDAYPRPVQKPHPPIVVGGMSPPALRRAVRQGNGWYGFALDPEQTATCVAGLREAEQRVDRPDALGQLELSVTPMGQVDAERCARYAELGVDRLVLLGMARDVPGMVAFIERSAESLLHAG
jgi:probable F420-dependent oxidoreductase